MNNINPYNEEQFREEFVKTDLYKQVADFYDIVYWDKWDKVKEHFTGRRLTPRESLGLRVGYVVVFYYLLELFKNNPDNVIDIGCGGNPFKMFFPNITGMEPNPSEWSSCDIVGQFDEEWVSCNQSKYDAAMAINSLHFIKYDNILNRLNEFASIIKVGGRGFITINPWVLSGQGRTSVLTVQSVIRDAIEKFEQKILILDIKDIEAGNTGDGINGNFRILFERTK